MRYQRNFPFSARLADRRRLSGKNSSKDVYHLTLDISGGGEILPYETGDWVAILPENSPKEVERLRLLLRNSGEETFSIRGRENPVPLADALRKYLTIGFLHRPLVEWLAQKTSACEKRVKMNEFLTPSFEKLIHGFSLADFLKQFGQWPLPISELLARLKPLMPRLYSIASSPKKNPGQLELVVATATHIGSGNEKRFGVCSSYLNHHLKSGEDSLQIYSVTSRMRLPENSQKDIIMVGPGAGIAPFMGFLQERDWEKSSGKTLGRSWLFFGDQHRESDFIFEAQLQNYLRRGILTHLSLAFSRDQLHKIYVQDRIREAGVELWKWLENGANFYICGDKRMADDVQTALLEVIHHQGNKTPEEAFRYGEMLRKSQRYFSDVY